MTMFGGARRHPSAVLQVVQLLDGFTPTPPVVAISGVLHAAFYL
jgi:hypothetical protein